MSFAFASSTKTACAGIFDDWLVAMVFYGGLAAMCVVKIGGGA